ncbi:MAG: hypothetical protein HQM13_04840 [SAR324 cluster bacterium]|nr:hypothetical protein [SAR324 cluster bacterium]
MKKRMGLLALSLFAHALLLGGSMVFAQERSELKELMSDNYARVTGILTNLLIDKNYDQTLKSVDLISAHADMILELDPTKTSLDHKQFKAYATQLKGHVDNLGVIVRNILEEKQAGGTPNNFLRPVASTHFGHVVTMCISCHNQYRK